jgi:transcriptional pleiotropic repressor
MVELIELLDKTRAINNIIQKASGGPVTYEDFAEILADVTESNVFVASQEGRLLGSAYPLEEEGPEFLPGGVREGSLSEAFNDWALGVVSTQVTRKGPEGSQMVVTPVYGEGDRLGTIFFFREKLFTVADIILAEAGATGIGIEAMRQKNAIAEKEHRKKGAVNLATNVLSFSELEAVKCLFLELKGQEGFIVASKLAQKYGLTRSVIVNALRKLESAGVIDARSLGMKGTFIRVLNEYLFTQLERM